MLRADGFHLLPSSASGCWFTFQWAVPGMYVGQKDYFQQSQTSTVFHSRLSRAGTPFVQSHSPNKMHYLTDAWMQTGPQLRTPSIMQGAAGSCTQPPREPQIQPPLSLRSSFSEAYFRPLQNVLQKSESALWNTWPGRVRSQEHQGMLCSTFLLRAPCWEYKRTSSCQNR